jgi:DoxX-like protein
MQAAALVNHSVRTTSWTGRVLSTLVVLFMVFDGVIHVLKPAPVADAFAQLGYPLAVSVGLGILELACTALYAIPRTAALGAVLLTAYLGGAVATQVRVGAGVFPTIFPVILGAILWTGLALRDARVRAFIKS